MTDVDAGAPAIAPAAASPARPVHWSLRREVWENRSLYIAPLVVAAVFLFGFLISTIFLPHRMQRIATLDAAKQRAAICPPYDAVAGLLVVTSLIIAVFYCLDALYGERRDRSILFWKSLPVSDRTAVLSKFLIPFAVLPLFVYAVAIVAQTIMLMASTLVLLGSPSSIALLWSNVTFVQTAIALLYGTIAIALWEAPVYAYLLLISAWARRTPFLWAVLPFLPILAVEHVVFRSTGFARFLQYRLTGWFEQAFDATLKHGGGPPIEPLQHLTPGRFLSAPGLWIGLVFAAVFLAAAVRLRRNREPI